MLLLLVCRTLCSTCLFNAYPEFLLPQFSELLPSHPHRFRYHQTFLTQEALTPSALQLPLDHQSSLGESQWGQGLSGEPSASQREAHVRSQ